MYVPMMRPVVISMARGRANSAAWSSRRLLLMRAILMRADVEGFAPDLVAGVLASSAVMEEWRI